MSDGPTGFFTSRYNKHTLEECDWTAATMNTNNSKALILPEVKNNIHAEA